MRPRPVFIAAMPREIASLVSRAGWRAEPKLLSRKIHLFEHEDAIVACAGMGAARASLAVEAALSLGPASELVSVGWAGACDPNYGTGEVIRAGIVIDTRTGERFFTTEPDTNTPRILVTVAVPAGAREKARLGESYRAAAVDMEAAAVARIARARAVPFVAIKVISDAMHFELPELSRFSTLDGQFREVAFGMHAALRPWLWKPVLTLARASTLSAQRLRLAIEAHILENRAIHP